MQLLSQVENPSYGIFISVYALKQLWGGIVMSEYSVVLTIGSFLILSYYIVYTIAKS